MVQPRCQVPSIAIRRTSMPRSNSTGSCLRRSVPLMCRSKTRRAVPENRRGAKWLLIVARFDRYGEWKVNPFIYVIPAFAGTANLLPRKPRHQFDMRAVTKLIDRRDAFDDKAAVDQGPRVAGKGRGVAGHRDHGRDLAGRELFDLRLRALPRRVEHHRIELAQFRRHQR